MASPDQLEQQLRVVSSAFLDQLQVKLRQMEEIWSTLVLEEASDRDTMQQMSDIAHELHGQGTFFGYPEVTQCAGAIEEILETTINRKTHLTFEARHAISNNIEMLQQTATNQKDDADLFGNDLDTISTISESRKSTLGSTPSKCILLIDDANIMRQKIALALREAGFEVLEAENGATGISLAYQQTPDLILLDIKMPEVNGFEVQKTIRENEELGDVPIIFITSLSRVSVAQIQDALSYGITDYVAKPFNMTRLIDKVRSVLQD